MKIQFFLLVQKSSKKLTIKNYFYKNLISNSTTFDIKCKKFKFLRVKLKNLIIEHPYCVVHNIRTRTTKTFFKLLQIQTFPFTRYRWIISPSFTPSRRKISTKVFHCVRSSFSSPRISSFSWKMVFWTR